MEYSKTELALYFMTMELSFVKRKKQIKHVAEVIKFFKNKLMDGNKMDKETAMKFQHLIIRKLSAEKVNVNDVEKAKVVLVKCVMGNRLVKAYTVLYGEK